MAKATKIDSDYLLLLELDRKEAEVLYFILNRVSGPSSNSPRQFSNEILDVLDATDICDRGDWHTTEGSSQIRFKEFPE